MLSYLLTFDNRNNWSNDHSILIKRETPVFTLPNVPVLSLPEFPDSFCICGVTPLLSGRVSLSNPVLTLLGSWPTRPWRCPYFFFLLKICNVTTKTRGLYIPWGRKNKVFNVFDFSLSRISLSSLKVKSKHLRLRYVKKKLHRDKVEQVIHFLQDWTSRIPPSYYTLRIRWTLIL